MDTKRLFRSKADRVIAGVCGGVADYFVIDPVLVRILFVLTAIFGAGFIIYLVLWIMMPEPPYKFE
jgi:phage shock protein PspC (stress-responsive transcriptional regulator)